MFIDAGTGLDSYLCHLSASIILLLFSFKMKKDISILIKLPD